MLDLAGQLGKHLVQQPAERDRQHPEQQRAVAERALQGGLPSVRSAVNEQNARLKAEGKEEIPAAGLLAMAEQMMPASSGRPGPGESSTRSGFRSPSTKVSSTAMRSAKRRAPLV